MSVQVGSPAPDFQAKAYLRREDAFKDLSLSDYKGRWLFLYFYPMDFTFVCPTEIQAFDESIGDFQDRDCELLTCSTDTHFVHRGWCEAKEELSGLRHPMLADVTKRVSMDYGVLVPEEGVALRGSFLIDPHGIVRWININDFPIGRNVHEVLRVLDALQTDEMCPCNWEPGQETLQPA
jgi:peroxiredoxin (alkyl hydroperoxide reductase subunit C)